MPPTGILNFIYSRILNAFRVVSSFESDATDCCVYGGATFSPAVDVDDFIDILFKIPAGSKIRVKDVICKAQNGTSTTGYVYIYEDVTQTGELSQVTPRNFNRDQVTPDDSLISVYSDPGSVTDLGDLIYFDVIYGSGNKGSGESLIDLPSTLKPGLTYLLRFTNKSSGPASMISRVRWSER